MWRQARQSLYTLGIPETDSAWDHVRTLPGSTGTGSSKAAAGPKRATGTVNAERKKNMGSTSKPLVEAKDEGVRPSPTAKVREEAMQAARSVKAVPMRDDNPPPRRPPGVSGPKNAREVAPTQPPSQAQGPSKKTGLTDARAKLGGSSKPNGRSDPATHIPTSSSHERELERERPTHPTKKEREDVSDFDREKGKTAAVHKAQKGRNYEKITMTRIGLTALETLSNEEGFLTTTSHISLVEVAVAEQRHANEIETRNSTRTRRLKIAISRTWLSGRVIATGAVRTLHLHRASQPSASVTDSVSASRIGVCHRPDVSNANILCPQLFTILTSGRIPPHLAR